MTSTLGKSQGLWNRWLTSSQEGQSCGWGSVQKTAKPLKYMCRE